MDYKNNGKRATRFYLLKNESGTTMMEIVVTVALIGALATGLLMISQNQTSLTSDSADKYAHLISVMLPIKKLKRDISMGHSISVTATSLEIKVEKLVHNQTTNTSILKNITIVYKNSTCTSGVHGKSALKEGKAVGSSKEIPCMVRYIKNAGSNKVTFLGIQTVKWCKGGSDPIGDCLTMRTDKHPEIPEIFDNKNITTGQLSERRFMAKFLDRTKRIITITLDLGNLYDSTLRDKVRITR